MDSNQTIKNDLQINSLVEKLRSKLNNFLVIDRQGESIGQVTNLILDADRQLNLVVSYGSNQLSSRLFLVSSKLIQKIDPPDKSVLVDIYKAQIGQLPEYGVVETASEEVSKISNIPQMSSEVVTDAGITSSSDRTLTAVTSMPLSEPLSTQNEPNNTMEINPSDTSKVLEEEIIRLLEERLVVDYNKRKVGEVIVRKQIETRMIQVPVRYEKLIVEQVSPEHKQLAEIDLVAEENQHITLPEKMNTGFETTRSNGLTVKGEFNSPKVASLLLNAIALERRHGCKRVRLEIVVEDTERQQIYQEWVDRSADKG